MGFEVLMPEVVRRKIAGWELGGHVLEAISAGLAAELAEHPARHLVGLPAPAEVLEYQLRVVEDDERRTRWLFTFAVAYGADESTLILRDCGYLCEDPSR